MIRTCSSLLDVFFLLHHHSYYHNLLIVYSLLLYVISTVREEMTAATNDTGECNCFTAVTIMSIFMNSIILFATIGGASTTTTTASSSTTTTSAKAKETFSLSSHDDESKEMKDNRVLKMIVTKKTDTSKYF
jgi:hypothetical protein